MVVELRLMLGEDVEDLADRRRCEQRHGRANQCLQDAIVQRSRLGDNELGQQQSSRNHTAAPINQSSDEVSPC